MARSPSRSASPVDSDDAMLAQLAHLDDDGNPWPVVPAPPVDADGNPWPAILPNSVDADGNEVDSDLEMLAWIDSLPPHERARYFDFEDGSASSSTEPDAGRSWPRPLLAGQG